MTRFAIVIPARYKSSRFPGKPLTLIDGVEMIVRVWRRCCEAFPAEAVYVATDDQRIADCCSKHGIQVVMTPDTCKTGTDRVYEASLSIGADMYINVQGDEPLVSPEDLRTVLEYAKAHPGRIVNAYASILSAEDFESPNVPKLVFRPDGRLLYMSRAPIFSNKEQQFRGGYRQVCIYAFPREPLRAFYEQGLTGKTPLEESEDIEILRFLEMDYEVQMVGVSAVSIAVDVPADVAKVERFLASVQNQGN